MLRNLNLRIRDFVLEAGNARLRAGTGSYSTPFRGTVFGHQSIDLAEARIAAGARCVLWLGANPNVPASVERILDKEGGDDWPDFERQLQSGQLGHVTAEGKSWDPVNDPPGKWTIYSEAFEQTGLRERTLMANVIPWGSSNTMEFLRPLREADHELAVRMLLFVDRLNVELVEATRPLFMVVPRSIADNVEIRRALPEFGLLRKQLAGASMFKVPANRSRAWRCYVGALRRGSIDVPTLVLPHPDAFRCSADARAAISAEVGAVMAELAKGTRLDG